MGWSKKHGLRPNRTRPLRLPGGKIANRREPCREVGVMTRTIVEVHVDRHGWHRATWSRDYALHPTKGFRVESPVRKSFDHDEENQPQNWRQGIYRITTFSRSQTKR